MLTLIRQFQEEFELKYGFKPSVDIKGHEVHDSLADNIISSFGEGVQGEYDRARWNAIYDDDSKIRITMFYKDGEEDNERVPF